MLKDSILHKWMRVVRAPEFRFAGERCSYIPHSSSRWSHVHATAPDSVYCCQTLSSYSSIVLVVNGAKSYGELLFLLSLISWNAPSRTRAEVLRQPKVVSKFDGCFFRGNWEMCKEALSVWWLQGTRSFFFLLVVRKNKRRRAYNLHVHVLFLQSIY